MGATEQMNSNVQPFPAARFETTFSMRRQSDTLELMLPKMTDHEV